MNDESLKENIGIIGSPVSSEAETEDQNVIDSPATSEAETKEVISPLETNPSPSSFERGIIASMSANDILMLKGLINPAVYVDSFDLGLFSHL